MEDNHRIMVSYPKVQKKNDMLALHLKEFKAQTVTFDTLDVFEASSGNMKIVNLTASRVPDDITRLVSALQEDIAARGESVENKAFRFHVTLGRINSTELPVEELCAMLKEIAIPPMTLRLDDIGYRVFRGQTLLQARLH